LSFSVTFSINRSLGTSRLTCSLAAFCSFDFGASFAIFHNPPGGPSAGSRGRVFLGTANG